jgi:exodeoxyribonuclease VII large subunit
MLRLVGDWITKLGRIWVEGQIAELNRRGGTVFLTLRDPLAAVSVRVICTHTVFDVTDPPPGPGARVIVWAKPDFNAARGSFALTALEVRQVGIGELLARLERLRKELAAEGLFATERKRRPPFLPRMIGLICGRESAAERDVRRTAANRWPAVRFRVEQVAVQGSQAVTEIIEALGKLDDDPDIDVIVITRGGGSVEDLLPFSDEALVRAVASCRTSVVSAIGHEQDSPLLDFVADVRASTPTDAAKRVVPDVAEQLAFIDQLRGRARRCLTGKIDRERAWLAAAVSRPALASPVREIERLEEKTRILSERALRGVSGQLDHAARDLEHTRARLLTLSPAETLRRGYAIVQQTDGSVVRTAAQVTGGEKLTVRFTDDQLTVTADQVKAEQPKAGQPKKKPTATADQPE